MDNHVSIYLQVPRLLGHGNEADFKQPVPLRNVIASFDENLVFMICGVELLSKDYKFCYLTMFHQ
jgi:hypothetical protein